MRIFIVRFRDSEGGATAIEYALIAGGVALGIFAAVGAVGVNLQALLNSVAQAFPH
jgi:pilus assembly protein Flp/PilA